MNLVIEQIEHADNIYARIKTEDGRFVAVWFQGDAKDIEFFTKHPISEADARDLVTSVGNKDRFEELLKNPVVDPNLARVDR